MLAEKASPRTCSTWLESRSLFLDLIFGNDNHKNCQPSTDISNLIAPVPAAPFFREKDHIAKMS